MLDALTFDITGGVVSSVNVMFAFSTLAPDTITTVEFDMNPDFL